MPEDSVYVFLALKMICRQLRNFSTHQEPSFYSNKILEQYAAKHLKTVSLRQLTVFGRQVTVDKLIKSANYIREELPVR